MFQSLQYHDFMFKIPDTSQKVHFFHNIYSTGYSLTGGSDAKYALDLLIKKILFRNSQFYDLLNYLIKLTKYQFC